MHVEAGHPIEAWADEGASAVQEVAHKEQRPCER